VFRGEHYGADWIWLANTSNRLVAGYWSIRVPLLKKKDRLFRSLAVKNCGEPKCIYTSTARKSSRFSQCGNASAFLGSKFPKLKIVLNLSKILSRNLGKGYDIILLLLLVVEQ